MMVCTSSSLHRPRCSFSVNAIIPILLVVLVFLASTCRAHDQDEIDGMGGENVRLTADKSIEGQHSSSSSVITPPGNLRRNLQPEELSESAENLFSDDQGEEEGKKGFGYYYGAKGSKMVGSKGYYGDDDDFFYGSKGSKIGVKKPDSKYGYGYGGYGTKGGKSFKLGKGSKGYGGKGGKGFKGCKGSKGSKGGKGSKSSGPSYNDDDDYTWTPPVDPSPPLDSEKPNSNDPIRHRHMQDVLEAEFDLDEARESSNPPTLHEISGAIWAPYFSPVYSPAFSPIYNGKCLTHVFRFSFFLVLCKATNSWSDIPLLHFRRIYW